MRSLPENQGRGVFEDACRVLLQLGLFLSARMALADVAGSILGVVHDRSTGTHTVTPLRRRIPAIRCRADRREK